MIYLCETSFTREDWRQKLLDSLRSEHFTLTMNIKKLCVQLCSSSLNMSKMAQLIQSKKTAKQQKVFYFAAEVIKPRQPKTTTPNVTTKVYKKLDAKKCGEIGPRGNRSVDITFTARTGGGNGLQINRKEGISLWMDQIDLKSEVPIRSDLYGCHAVSVKTKSRRKVSNLAPKNKSRQKVSNLASGRKVSNPMER